MPSEFVELKWLTSINLNMVPSSRNTYKGRFPRCVFPSDIFAQPQASALTRCTI
jgi:hypothetical protein